MNCNIISSGSKGNAVVLNGVILIDCGVSFKALKDVCRDLKIVLLSHIHSDHFKKSTIRRLAADRPTLRFAAPEWLYESLIKCGVDDSKIDIVEIGKIYDYGAFKISPVKLYHDCPTCGYRIFLGEEKALYATDTYTLDGIAAKNYDLYLIECNYEDEEIKERIREKEEKGEFVYEKRVLRTHLSKADCDNFLVENAGAKSEFIYMHTHEDR